MCLLGQEIVSDGERHVALERAVVDLVLDGLLGGVVLGADRVGLGLVAGGRHLGGHLGLERALQTEEKSRA